MECAILEITCKKNQDYDYLEETAELIQNCWNTMATIVSAAQDLLPLNVGSARGKCRDQI